MIEANREKHLKEFVEINKIPEIDLELLDRALTHKSYANEFRGRKGADELLHMHNERLEFLGDAILGNTIAKALFLHFKDHNEGILTKRKAQAVCEPTLAEIGKTLKIGSILRMGKGELATGGAERPSNIANAVEALLGAIFLHHGYTITEEFVKSIWKSYIFEDKIAEASIDFKSGLQEYLTKKLKVRPDYQILREDGPDHEKEYLIGLFVKGSLEVKASGGSRKKAEQKAAKEYIEKNQIQIGPFRIS